MYWQDTLTLVWYCAIIAMTCFTTTTLALCCSVLFRKTAISMMTSYMVLAILFFAPMVVWLFVHTISSGGMQPHEPIWLSWSTGASPLAAAFSLPISLGEVQRLDPAGGLLWSQTARAFVLFAAALDAALVGLMLWLFDRRWRIRE